MKLKRAQDIVLETIEGSLPVYFWIGVGIIVILAYKSANLFGKFMFGTFLSNLFIYLLGLFVSFYLLYFLKDVREKLTMIAQNSQNNNQ